MTRPPSQETFSSPPYLLYRPFIQGLHTAIIRFLSTTECIHTRISYIYLVLSASPLRFLPLLLFLYYAFLVTELVTYSFRFVLAGTPVNGIHLDGS